MTTFISREKGRKFCFEKIREFATLTAFISREIFHKLYYVIFSYFRYYILPDNLPLENLLADDGLKKKKERGRGRGGPGGGRGGRGAGGGGGGGARGGRGRGRGGPRGRGRGRGR